MDQFPPEVWKPAERFRLLILRRFCRQVGVSSEACEREGERDVDHVKLGVHIWVSVLILGTLWRLTSYHLVASDNVTLQHLGRAMAQQY